MTLNTNSHVSAAYDSKFPIEETVGKLQEISSKWNNLVRPTGVVLAYHKEK